MTMQVHLKLEAIRLGAVLFRPNVSEVNDWNNTSFPLNISVEVIKLEDKKGQIITVVEVDIGDLEKEKSGYPCDLIINYAGFFSIKPEDLTEKDIKRIAGINCAAIIFPFLREEIADLTMKAFNKPLLLPPVNFVALFKEKGVKFTRISESEEELKGNFQDKTKK